jgi:hypothetical protein
MKRHQDTGILTATLFAAAAAMFAGATPAYAAFGVTSISILKGSTTLDSSTINETFNKALCDCNTTMTIRALLTLDASSDVPLKVVTGSSCEADEEKIDANCRVLKEAVVRDLTSSTWDISIGASSMMTTSSGSCSSGSDGTNFKVYIFHSPNKDDKWTKLAESATYAVDTSPPEQPAKASEPVCGQGQVSLSWSGTGTTTTSGDAGTTEAGTGATSTVGISYQILCTKSDGSAPGLSSKTAAFDSNYTVCATSTMTADGGSEASVSDLGLDLKVDSSVAGDSAVSDLAADATTPDSSGKDAGADTAAGDGSTPDAVSVSTSTLLSQAYVCSDKITSSGSVDITGLDGSTTYKFYVIAIDERRNPTEPVYLGEMAPCLEEDFFERYKRSGGKAEGCKLGSDQHQDDGIVVVYFVLPIFLLGLWRLIGAPPWRRIRDKRNGGHR